MARLRERLKQARTIEEVYECIPNVACRQKCQQACGPILMSKPEWDAIIERLGYAPKGKPCLTCPMLDKSGNCTVYDIRPTICRLYGIVPGMRCEHGCQPDQPLSDMEGGMILRRIDALAAEMENTHGTE